MQVILADLLKASGLVPDRVFGLNKGLTLGVLGVAYWDGAITLQEALQCVVAISGSCSAEDLPEIAHYVCKNTVGELASEESKKSHWPNYLFV